MAKVIDAAQLPSEVQAVLLDQAEPVIIERNGAPVAVVSPHQGMGRQNNRPSPHAKCYRWIQENRERLRREYPGKTILVHGTEIAQVFDGPMNPIDLNRIAKQEFEDDDWAFTYLDPRPISLL